MYFATADSKAATGTVTDDPYGYFNFAGNPSPTLLDWFPSSTRAPTPARGQAGWSVTATPSTS